MDSENLIIDTCHIDDIDIVKHIHEQNYGKVWDKYFFEKMLKETQYEIYIIKSNNKVSGFIAFQGVGNAYELIMIIVDKYYRNNGLGSYLLSEAIRKLKLKGVSLITLDVSNDNIIAQKLYKKHGFVKFGERLGYYNINNKKINSESYKLVNF
tara:strand:- start:72706 stop:73164 length:459 start_codon:yes stop_codon:yes gene_type:complete